MFAHSGAALSVGSLVKDKDFQLFDAIGALEVSESSSIRRVVWADHLSRLETQKWTVDLY